MNQVKSIENKLVNSLLSIDHENDFRFSDLVVLANQNFKAVGLKNEKEILDSSELFSLGSVIKKNYGEMFVYSFQKWSDKDIYTNIIRVRRKLDISLDYRIDDDSTIDTLLECIKYYIGDNKAITVDARPLYKINESLVVFGFVKEYKNEQGQVFNKDLCVLRVSIAKNLEDANDVAIKENIVAKMYSKLIHSDLAKEASNYEEELMLSYSAEYAHIYTDVLDTYFNIDAEKNETILDKAKLHPTLYYGINKELATCDFITSNALKMEQFKKQLNNHISIPEYKKALDFALGRLMDIYIENSPIAASLFLLCNLDKTTLQLARELKRNTENTKESITEVYNKAVDISIITSKDILAAIIDGEELSFKIDKHQAWNMLSIYNNDLKFMQDFKDLVIQPILDKIIEDVLTPNIPDTKEESHEE